MLVGCENKELPSSDAFWRPLHDENRLEKFFTDLDLHAHLKSRPTPLSNSTQPLSNPVLPDTRRDLAMVHYELGQLDAAKDELIDALRLAPDDAWSHVVMGDILTRQQDWTSAIRFFSKALDLKPDYPYALNGQPDQAITAFDAAIAAHPKMPEPRFGKALALQRQARLHPAADTLQAFIDTAGSNSPIIEQSKKLLAAIESEIREQGGPTNPELLQENTPPPCGICSTP